MKRVNNIIFLYRQRISLSFDQTEVLEDFYLKGTKYPLVDQIQLLIESTQLSSKELKVYTTLLLYHVNIHTLSLKLACKNIFFLMIKA